MQEYACGTDEETRGLTEVQHQNFRAKGIFEIIQSHCAWGGLRDMSYV